MLPSSVRAGMVFLLSFGVYLATCARDVTLVDSGELILACAGVGVAHPPGFPLYTILGFLFSKLPLGSVAFRVALMSGFFGAVTAALITLLVGELFSEKGWLSELAAMTTGLVFAWGATPWFFASVAEVYTLHTALLALTLWLVFFWRREYLESGPGPRASMLSFGSGMVFGLALCVHHVTAALVLPAVLYLGLATLGWRVALARYAMAGLTGSVVGLLPYLYLPLAALRRPIMNWGDPSSWERFVAHVTASQYRVNLFSGEPGALGRHVVEFLGSMAQQFTWMGLVGVLLGLAVCWRINRVAFWTIFLLVIFGVAYAANYDIDEDKEAYYLVSFIAAAMALGAAFTRLARWGSAGRSGARAVAAALLVLLPAANAVAHWQQNDRRRDTTARFFVEDAAAGIEKGGVLLTQEWQVYAPFLYLHHLEAFRPDLMMVDANLVRRSWYVRTYLDRVYPKLMDRCAQERDSFLRMLERWEGGRPFEEVELTNRFRGLLNCILEGGTEAHLTLPMEPGVGRGGASVPWGLTLLVSPTTRTSTQTPPAVRVQHLIGSPQNLEPAARSKVVPAYAIMLANRARYLALKGQLSEAEETLRQAEVLAPDHPAVVDTRAGLRGLQKRQ